MLNDLDKSLDFGFTLAKRTQRSEYFGFWINSSLKCRISKILDLEFTIFPFWRMGTCTKFFNL